MPEQAKEQAPEFMEGLQWLNAEPQTLRSLRGEVVVLVFWRFSCTNCLPLLPFLDSWLQTYGPVGLTVIGVHTPQYDFEAEPANVRRFLEGHLIAWPVVLDNDRRLWEAYGVEAWPTVFLLDEQGRIRYRHVGKGAYEDTEEGVRVLLQQANPSVDLSLAASIPAASRGAACYPASREIRCGYEDGSFSSAQQILHDQAHFYTLPASSEEETILLDGPWIVRPDHLERPSGTLVRSSAVVRYRGVEANAVMSTGKQPAGGINVLQDGYQIAERIRGADLMVPGRFTVAEVAGPKAYNFVRGARYARHELRVETNAPGIRIYAFTFSGCEDETAEAYS